MILFLSTLRREIFSKKSIFVCAFFTVSAYFMGKYSTVVTKLLDSNASSALIESLFIIYALLGYLFASVLFSGLISGEVESQTMRFLTPYISRRVIYLSKYAASAFYFLILTFLSLLIVFATKGLFSIPPYSLLSIVGFYLYIQSVVMLVSTISKSERLSSLLNLMLSILFPVLYTISILKNWVILEVFRWFLPYHYLAKTWEVVVLYLLSAVLVFIGLRIFEEKEV